MKKSSLKLLILLMIVCYGPNLYCQIWVDPVNTNMSLNPAWKEGQVVIGKTNPATYDAQLEVSAQIPLTNQQGANVMITRSGGFCGANFEFKEQNWLFRSSPGSGFSYAVIHNGLTLNNNGNVPGTDTKTWWQRDPSLDIQSWGHNADTYMRLEQGMLGVNTIPVQLPGSLSGRLQIQEAGSMPCLTTRAWHGTDGKYGIISSVKRDLAKAIAVEQSWYLNSTTPNPKETFVVYGNGLTNIGIKKVNQGHPHVDALLQVYGKIACTELVVLDPTQWSDFVFDSNYKLRSLKQVEEFYKANKHLPDVPSEKEVKRNGINAAEMDATLLQKIEELTLYVVELNKKIQQLEEKARD